MMISELANRNQIENRRTPQDLESFQRTSSISPEQEEVLRSTVHEKCNYISTYFMEIDSVSNETIPEVATAVEKRKDKLKNVPVKEHRMTLQKFVISSSLDKIEEILPKVLKVETDL